MIMAQNVFLLICIKKLDVLTIIIQGKWLHVRTCHGVAEQLEIMKMM